MNNTTINANPPWYALDIVTPPPYLVRIFYARHEDKYWAFFPITFYRNLFGLFISTKELWYSYLYEETDFYVSSEVEE